MGIAAMMYIQDYDGAYPKAYMFPAVDMGPLGYNYGNWYVLLVPYVQSGDIYRCPSLSQNLSGSQYTIAALGITYSQLGYGWNIGTNVNSYRDGFGYYFGDNQPVRYEADLDAPAQTILLGDISVYSGNYRYLLWTGSTTHTPDLHNNGANYTYADGHAKWHSQSEILGNPELFRTEKN